MNQKTECLNIQIKKRQPKVSELKTGGNLHEFDKPGWSAGDTRLPKNAQASSFSYENFVVRLIFELNQSQQNNS